MKLNQLREVVAIAEHGSIRSAARALRTGQPALTRSLAELERELGASLFERRSRGVVPTPLGQLFVRRATSIVNEVRRARDEAGQLGGSGGGTVTAGLSIAAHMALLPPTLRPFAKRFPDAKLHVIEGFYPTLEPGLRDGSIDFYVGVDPGQRVAPELAREAICPNRRTVLCRSGHPLAKATGLAQLAGAGWITNSVTLDDADELGPIFERHGLPVPRVAVRSQSALTLMTCLLNTDLLSMVPVQWDEFPLTRDLLTTIPVREELSAPSIVLIKRADLVLTPAAGHFLDLLRRTQLGRAPAGLPGPVGPPADRPVAYAMPTRARSVGRCRGGIGRKSRHLP